MQRRFTPVLVALVFATLASSASAQERRVELRFQGGAEVGVPIFFNVDREIVKPGASLQGWAGFDIGWVVFEFALGLHWTPIDTNKIPEAFITTGFEPLVRLSFSPGVRFQVPLYDAVLPYVNGAFDANIWSFAALGQGCAWFYCRSDSLGQFAPGFSGKAGVGIHLKGSMYLDVGMQYSISWPGSFFERRQMWAEPFIGFIYRGDSDRFGGTGY